MSTSRCTLSCLGSIFPVFSPCKRPFPACRYSGMAAVCSAALAAWCCGVANRYALWAFCSKRQDGGAKSRRQLPGGDRLRPVGVVGQPPAPLTVTPSATAEENSSKLAAVAGLSVGSAAASPCSFQTVCRGVIPPESWGRSACPVRPVPFLRPIFPVCDTVLAAVQEVDLVKSFRWHISDLGLE